MAWTMNSPPVTLLGGCFALFGALFALIGVVFGLSSLKLSFGTVRTEGRVVAVQKQEQPANGQIQFRLSRASSFIPVVQYEVNGQSHTCQGIVAVPRDHYRVGDRVSVLYRANDPAQGTLDSVLDRYVFPFGLVAFGMVFIALGAFLARPRKPSPS